MGFVRKRRGTAGAAVYRDVRGKVRHAGTFPTRRQAEKAWQRAEALMSAANIRQQKIILSAVFTTALNDFVIVLHPCKGVKTPTVAVKEYRIVTLAEFDVLLTALPSDSARLFIETAIGSGLRWGELTELRVADLHAPSGIVTITRDVVELSPKFHPDGGRFLVKPYPKSKRARRFKLEPELVSRLVAHVEHYGLGSDDLIFRFDTLHSPATGRRLRAVEDLGRTEPNAAARTYAHGSLSAYTAGRCRCPHGRAAFAEYRAGRRADGLDAPRGVRERDTDGHLPRDWFRNHVWRRACDEAGLDPRPRLHDLRHSHASWLLAGGADLQVVKERLGHGSIATTGKYLPTLPTADETALAALRRIRGTS
ncbi:tyrosine-type recombinase/integrase [uncultured Jatrophihabitans sp.]|uniref:tyrosine-type recombinase/integrase n=1 Tax=uncultured Jatrophihabitans sp. TaxID=1610747 RepID=UPI0035CBD006